MLRYLPYALLVIVYLGLAVVVTWPAWVDPVHTFLGPGGDNQQVIGFFAVTQHAIATGSDPFYTTQLNAPDGVNLAWESASPLLAVVVWPIDALWGPVSGYDAALTAALAANGIVATLVLRRVIGGWAGPLVGGALYAMSPFAMSQGRGHLDLAVMVTAPLLVLVLDRMLRRRPDRWVLNGLLLAAIVVVQYFLFVEMLLDEAIGFTVVLLALAVTHPGMVRARVRTVVQSCALALVVSGLCVAWPIHVFATFPQRPAGPLETKDVFVTNLANLVVPNQFAAINPLRSLGSSFSGNGGEATAYIGIPLLVLLAGVVVWQRRRRVVWATVLTCAVLALLSFGAYLHVGSRVVTQVPLPWLLAEKTPIIQNVLPVRMWEVIDVALVFLVACAVREAAVARPWVRAGVGVLLVLTVVTWLPQLPWQSSTPPVPAFFTGDARRIPAGSTVLLSPLPYEQQGNAMLWQAWTGVRFAIPGGSIPGPEYRKPRTLPHLSAAMLTIEDGNTPLPVDAGEFRAELAATGIRTVVNGPGPQMSQLDDLLTEVCGAGPEHDQGVEVWWTCAG